MVQFERHKIYVNSKPVILKSHLNTQIQMKFWLNEFERKTPTGVCVKKNFVRMLFYQRGGDIDSIMTTQLKIVDIYATMSYEIEIPLLSSGHISPT